MSVSLRLETVLDLHCLLINRFGGVYGVRNVDALQGVLDSPFQTFDGEELYPTVIDKAVQLCVSMLYSHPFVDGNKRVALACLGAFLGMHGLTIEDDADSLYNRMIALSTHKMDAKQFYHYVFDHVQQR